MTTRLTEPATAPHQIVLFLGWPAGKHLIALACTCMPRRGDGRGRPRISSRRSFPAAEAIAAWHAWHEENGVVL